MENYVETKENKSPGRIAGAEKDGFGCVYYQGMSKVPGLLWNKRVKYSSTLSPLAPAVAARE